MTHGVVSILDQNHYRVIENLWAEMHQRFGVGNPDILAMPHMSYHTAEKYDEEKLAVILEEVASQERPFTITASGIGIFPAPNPIVYVPVVRTADLTNLHTQLCTQLDPIAQNSNPFFAPDSWIPHITLGNYDITLEKLGPISQWLHQQAINLTITIDNLYVLTDETSDYIEMFSVKFRGD